MIQWEWRACIWNLDVNDTGESGLLHEVKSYRIVFVWIVFYAISCI